MIRRIVIAAAMLLVIVDSISPFVLSLPFRDRTVIEKAIVRRTDRTWWPEYPRFLNDVRQQTREGDSIALVVPAPHWDFQYFYAYFRASYFLAGREVLPIVQPGDRLVPQNIARARYVASWRMPPAGRGPIVWRSHEGLLVRQR